jgi:hypothetical protein
MMLLNRHQKLATGLPPVHFRCASRWRLFALAFFLLVVATGCKTRWDVADSLPMTLREQPSLGEVEIPFVLRFAQDKGIPYKVFRRQIRPLEEVSYIDSKTYRLRIAFGRVTKEQYDLLMDRYGGQKIVPFEADRQYELIDFLPPKIQVFDGKWFTDIWSNDARIPEALRDPRDVLESPGTPAGVSVSMNCWGMAYEVLRQAHEPFTKQTLHIGMFLNDRAATTFTKNQYFDLVETVSYADLKPNAKSPSERNAKRQFLDALVLNFDSLIGPAHVALWIDEDLYFEKTNSGDLEPMRLNTYEGVVTPFLPDASSGVTAKVLILRHGKEKTRLPALSAFADQHPFEANAAQMIPQAIKGRYIYDQTANAAGGLGRILIQDVRSFPLAVDNTSKRVISPGADSLKGYFDSEFLCRFKSESLTYEYLLDRTLTLKILNPKTGTEVARLKGSYVGGEPAANTEVVDWVRFPSGDKVLRFYGPAGNKEADVRKIFFEHPGVLKEYEFSTEGAERGEGCIRNPRYFDKM